MSKRKLFFIVAVLISTLGLTYLVSAPTLLHKETKIIPEYPQTETRVNKILEWPTYKNSTNGFRVQYPPFLNVGTSGESGVFFISIANIDKPPLGFAPIRLSVQTQPEESLQKFAETHTYRMASGYDYPESYISQVEDVSVVGIPAKKITVIGRKATEISSEISYADSTHHILWFYSGKVYDLFVSKEISSKDEKRMIESFIFF